MATQQDLLDQVGRLTADASGTAFPPAVRAYHLQGAYAMWQARIREIAPDEFLVAATANIAVWAVVDGGDGTRRFYQRPTFEHVRRYEIRFDTATTTPYKELRLILTEQGVPLTGEPVPTFCAPCYSVEGQKIRIWPEPTADVTKGLRVVYVEVASLSAAADVPRMPAALHHLLAYDAAIRCLEESKDASESIVNTWRRRVESLRGPGDAGTPQSRRALAAHFRQAQAYSMRVTA